MIEFQLPKHASHSAINSYIRCGKAYELGKLGVKELPAWWLLGGSAVHKATEWIDKGEWDTQAAENAFYEAFYTEIVAAEQSHPDQSTWRKAGYGARAQGYDHWMKQGPLYVKQWADNAADWDYVELDVSATLPSGIKIKAYVDRVNVHDGFYDNHSTATDYASIYDLKTGSTRPDSDQQLGIYSVLTSLKLGLPIFEASNYMFKDDEFYEMDVSNWTLETVDEIAKEWYNGISSGVFLPIRGKQCGTCGVRDACFLATGDSELSRRYDKLNPNYGE